MVTASSLNKNLQIAHPILQVWLLLFHVNSTKATIKNIGQIFDDIERFAGIDEFVDD